MKLKKKAKKNTTVTKKKAVAKGKSEEETLKRGVPVDHIRKQAPLTDKRLIGMSKGVTKNMGDYESLRVDCWLSDFLDEDENPINVYKRLSETIDEQILVEIEEFRS